MKKQLISTEKKYIESIGKWLHIEKFDDGSEFYCLLDKYGKFNIVDTGKTYDEIKKQIKFWEDMISRGVIRIL